MNGRTDGRANEGANEWKHRHARRQPHQTSWQLARAAATSATAAGCCRQVARRQPPSWLPGATGEIKQPTLANCSRAICCGVQPKLLPMLPPLLQRKQRYQPATMLATYRLAPLFCLVFLFHLFASRNVHHLCTRLIQQPSSIVGYLTPYLKLTTRIVNLD